MQWYAAGVREPLLRGRRALALDGGVTGVSPGADGGLSVSRAIAGRCGASGLRSTRRAAYNWFVEMLMRRKGWSGRALGAGA